MDSEESTCSVESLCDEESAKEKAGRESFEENQKEVRICQLEARVKYLEMELEKARSKLLQKDREELDVAKAQQELLQELKKRKAVQYELICTGQQLCEMQQKIYEQEKQIQKLSSVKQSPALRTRVLTTPQVSSQIELPLSRHLSQASPMEGSTCDDSPVTVRSISTASMSPVEGSDRFGSKEAPRIASKESSGLRTPRVSAPLISNVRHTQVFPASMPRGPASGTSTPMSARIRPNFASTPGTPMMLQSVLVPSQGGLGVQSPVWAPMSKASYGSYAMSPRLDG